MGEYNRRVALNIPQPIIDLVASIGGERIKNILLHRPQIRVYGIQAYRQNETLTVWRGKVANTSKSGALAEQVKVKTRTLVENGKRRENFLSSTLRWTHGSERPIDIPAGDEVDLDVFEQILIQPNQLDPNVIPPRGYFMVRIASGEGQGIRDFNELNPGRSVLTFALSERHGVSLTIRVSIEWDLIGSMVAALLPSDKPENWKQKMKRLMK